MLGLQAHATMPSLRSTKGPTQGFTLAWYAFYQQNYTPSPRDSSEEMYRPKQDLCGTLVKVQLALSQVEK